MCGSDGLTYNTPCALNEESVRRESSPGLPELTMVYWGPCLEAPTIISPPEGRQKTILNLPFLVIGHECRRLIVDLLIYLFYYRFNSYFLGT